MNILSIDEICRNKRKIFLKTVIFISQEII